MAEKNSLGSSTTTGSPRRDTKSPPGGRAEREIFEVEDDSDDETQDESEPPAANQVKPHDQKPPSIECTTLATSAAAATPYTATTTTNAGGPNLFKPTPSASSKLPQPTINSGVSPSAQGASSSGSWQAAKGRNASPYNQRQPQIPGPIWRSSRNDKLDFAPLRQLNRASLGDGGMITSTPSPRPPQAQGRH